MASVAQILQTKADRTVYTIAPTASVFEAIARLAEKNIGALPVVDAGQTVGLFSERAYTRRVELAGRASRQTPVAEVMDAPVLYVRPEHSAEECMALMTEKRLRHLVVIDAGELVGLISIGDVVKATISEQHFVIEQLEHYIAGNRGW